MLDSWLFSFKLEDGYESFLKTLNREPIQPTKRMLDGQMYENVLNNVLNVTEIPVGHEWYPVITEMAEELQGAQQQVNLFADSGIIYNGV